MSGFILETVTWPKFKNTADRKRWLKMRLENLTLEDVEKTIDPDIRYSIDISEYELTDTLADAIVKLGDKSSWNTEQRDTTDTICVCDENGKLFKVHVFICVTGETVTESLESTDWPIAQSIDRLSDVCEIRELCQMWSIIDHEHLKAKSSNR